MADENGFGRTIQDVKRARDAAKAQELAKAAQEREQRKKMKEDAAAVLRAQVIPILNEARTALSGEGITLVVREDCGPSDGRLGSPEIIVQCQSEPFRNRGGGTTNPKSDKLFISCDGTSIEWGFAAEFSSKPESRAVSLQAGAAHLRERLYDALKTCLESYYRALDSGSGP